MSRTDEARAFLESWDPDAVELPDWVVDELEATPELQARFDARFTPWDGQALGLAPPPAPAEPKRAAVPSHRPWVRSSLAALSLLAAGGLLVVGGYVGLAGYNRELQAVSKPEAVEPKRPPVDDGKRGEVQEPREGLASPVDPAEGVQLRTTSDTRRPKGSTVTEKVDGIADLDGTRDQGLDHDQTFGRGRAFGPSPPQGNVQEAEYWRDELGHYRQPFAGGLDEQNGRFVPSVVVADPATTVSKVVVMQQDIRITDRVTFEPGQTVPPPESEPLLDEVAKLLKERPELGRVRVEGHSEASGDAATRQHRSEDRATQVRDGLIARGVPPERLVAAGYGDTRPIAPGHEPINARVEFLLENIEAPPAPVPAPVPVPADPPASEEYTDWGHHSFEDVDQDPLSTFSIDVDTASYSMVRRKLGEGYLPPAAAVRVEEFVNAMTYTYPPPPDGSPFGVSFEAAPNPFNPRTHLVRVGVQGRRVAVDQRRPVHLTFLVDTSGSMQSDDKLPLAQYALKSLTSELRDGDTVAIVAYAGAAGVVLPPTPLSQERVIQDALTRLTAGGSTAMGQGIDLAYRLADQTYEDDAVNRVIIVSDGDANVGQTDAAVLTEQIRGYARKGITLTVAGFGMGNYKDTRMEALADDGDGNYWYIDSEDEAREVFVDRLTSTLVVIAKDVKIQVDWDPATVEAYRLVGYENRDIADEDFRDDGVDAGEIGAGHQVTALYEVALAQGASGHLATVAVRNKAPGPDSPAVERSFELTSEAIRPEMSETSANFRLAVASASFAERLRGSPHLHGAGYDPILAMARSAVRAEYPEDRELVRLISRAAELSGR